MIKWLIATDDGKTHELHYRQGTWSPFTLLVNGQLLTPRFANVQQVKDALKELDYTITEFLQVQGDTQWPIDPHRGENRNDHEANHLG